MKLSGLSEWQIRKAQAEGQFDDLKGAGKPLPTQDDGNNPANVGLRIMAEAGVLPKEIQLKKAIDAQQSALKDITDPAIRKQALALLADLEMRYAIEQEARRKCYSTK